MKHQHFHVRFSSVLKYTFIVLCFAGLAFSSSAYASTITGLVETPNSLSFNFSGNGFSDFVTPFLPPLTNWSLSGGEVHSQNSTKYGFGIFNLQHLPDGSVLPLLGDGGFNTPYGTTLTDTKTIAHGSGFDSYFVTITVNQSVTGSPEWGTFSGSFSAVHNAPEGGSTVLMTLIGFLLLAGVRTIHQTNRV
jgi:hypothetical protein